MSDQPSKPKNVDGATLRLYRSMEIGKWIKDQQDRKKSVTFDKIRAYAFAFHGLSKRATNGILKDMENAGFINSTGRAPAYFRITENGEKWLKTLDKNGEF